MVVNATTGPPFELRPTHKLLKPLFKGRPVIYRLHRTNWKNNYVYRAPQTNPSGYYGVYVKLSWSAQQGNSDFWRETERLQHEAERLVPQIEAALQARFQSIRHYNTVNGWNELQLRFER